MATIEELDAAILYAELEHKFANESAKRRTAVVLEALRDARSRAEGCEFCAEEVLKATGNNDDFCRRCGRALREKAERENPKPLTLEELHTMDRKPVFWVNLHPPKSYPKGEWCLCRVIKSAHGEYVSTVGGVCAYGDIGYGKAFIAYAHEPKGADR